MNVDYFYCSYCGYEDFDIFAAFSAHYSNGDFLICPNCGKETSAQQCVNADSGDSHPAENLPTPGVSRAQEGGR